MYGVANLTTRFVVPGLIFFLVTDGSCPRVRQCDIIPVIAMRGDHVASEIAPGSFNETSAQQQS